MGEALVILPDRGVCFGEWNNGQMSGYGILTRPDGFRYEGFFKEGRRHGRGKLT